MLLVDSKLIQVDYRVWAWSRTRFSVTKWQLHGQRKRRELCWEFGEQLIFSQLDGIVRNRTIYQKIAADHTVLGYDRTWQQCKTKIKNMVQKYKKVIINLQTHIIKYTIHFCVR